MVFPSSVPFEDRVLRVLIWLSSIAALCACIEVEAKELAPFSSPVEQCILPAAQYQTVNPHVLRAILAVESNLNPSAIGRNANGTIDVGMGQMNSIHFKDLEKYGISPQHLTNPCIATYVAAWHLRKLIHRYGNTWETIARYHSATPALNQRYQVLLQNQLAKASGLPGPLKTVSPRIWSTESDQAKVARDNQKPDPSNISVFDASN